MSATKTRGSNGRGAELPIRPIRIVQLDSGEPGFINRLLMATPTKGVVRIEWHAGVRGMMVPPNWSMVSMSQFVSEMFPIRFTVADAQNLIVKEAIARDFEWVLLLEDDVIPPADLLVKLSEYMIEGPPIVSGLYYTKGAPSEPLIYRGRGTGSYSDWKPGQKVWADGVPTGCLLIHCSILREMWKDSKPYQVLGGNETREVFVTPMRAWISPRGDVNTATGTSDLEWCTRVIEGGYLKKAGWSGFARRKYPFLVDTALRCTHIALDGTKYPPAGG